MRGIPKRYKDRTFENFDPSVSKSAAAAFEAAQDAAKNRTSLVLIGRPGTGKTHLAAAIGNTFSDGPDHFYSEWANVADLVNELRQDIRTSGNDGHKWFAEIERSKTFVVLDDLGREKVSDFAGEAIYRLVNARYEQIWPTVVTSNLTMVELEANGYGPVISRLSEEGRIVEMASATDYRARRKAA